MTRIIELAHALGEQIAKSAEIKNLETAKSNLAAAKALGFCAALDDIGSGYTSIRNLCDYPVAFVKLDRAILLLTNTEKGKKLFHGIISLVHKLDLKMVCEGVETEEQNALVGASDCDFIQGWYYSKALPVGKAEQFAREYKNRA